MESLISQLLDKAPKRLKQNKSKYFICSTKAYLELRYKKSLNGIPVQVSMDKRYYLLQDNGVPVVRHLDWNELRVGLTVYGNHQTGKSL